MDSQEHCSLASLKSRKPEPLIGLQLTLLPGTSITIPVDFEQHSAANRRLAPGPYKTGESSVARRKLPNAALR